MTSAGHDRPGASSQISPYLKNYTKSEKSRRVMIERKRERNTEAVECVFFSHLFFSDSQAVKLFSRPSLQFPNWVWRCGLYFLCACDDGAIIFIEIWGERFCRFVGSVGACFGIELGLLLCMQSTIFFLFWHTFVSYPHPILNFQHSPFSPFSFFSHSCILCRAFICLFILCHYIYIFPFLHLNLFARLNATLLPTL